MRHFLVFVLLLFLMRQCVWDVRDWIFICQRSVRKATRLSKKEQDSIRDMRIVQEMYARGLEFMPIDLYRAKANRFQIIDGKLMPSLNSIDGMGDKAAEAVVDAAKTRQIPCLRMISETEPKSVRQSLT